MCYSTARSDFFNFAGIYIFHLVINKKTLHFWTLGKAVATVEAKSDDNEIEIAMLPPAEDGNLTNEEHIGK